MGAAAALGGIAVAYGLAHEIVRANRRLAEGAGVPGALGALTVLIAAPVLGMGLLLGAGGVLLTALRLAAFGALGAVLLARARDGDRVSTLNLLLVVVGTLVVAGARLAR